MKKKLSTIIPLILVVLATVGLVISPESSIAGDAPQSDIPDFRAQIVETNNQALSSSESAVFPNALTNVATLDGTPFPHVALYGGPNGSGWSLVGSTAKLGTCVNNPAVSCTYNTDCGNATTTCTNTAQDAADNAPLNTDVLDKYARFPQVILSPTPLSDGRLDIIPALRARNPAIKIFAYTVGHQMWCPGGTSNSYPAGYYYRDYYLGVNNGDPTCMTDESDLLSTSNRFLWRQDGTLSGYDVNLAYREQQPDLSYRYSVAEAIAEATYEHAKASRGFDGIFIDVFCPNYLWAENQSNPWNYVKAGYANQSEFAAGWAAGHQVQADRLRALAIADGQPNYPISGNCAQAPASLHPVLNGWMREAYPFQNGGTFFSNMQTWPWGYLHQDRNFLAPQYNYIFTAANPPNLPYSTLNQQKLRFGLGSASLGNGYHIFEESSGYHELSDYPNWWFDEYGVDTTVRQDNLEWGKAKSGVAYTGWLGQPRGDFYNMIFPNPSALTIPTNDFELNLNNVSILVSGGAQATIDRQTSGAAVGSGDLHVNITQVGSGASSVFFNSNTFTASSSSYYSVTFYAKASQPRAMNVYVGGAGMTIPISDTWKRYQVSVKGANGTSVYQFQLGHEAGELWFDDIQIQTGIGNVYRRDFDKGSVLLNPYQATVTATLEKPFRKIQGTVNQPIPAINDGSVVNSVTLTPDIGQGIGDAIFLLNYDPVAPGMVTNLATQ